MVARHQEHLGWLDQLDGWKTLLVQKERDLPNEGREASSFFWALAKLRGRAKPEGLYAFLQGDPEPHYALAGLDADADSVSRSKQGFRWLGNERFLAGPDGNPHHGGLPLRERYEQWLGRPWPGQVSFAPGGQFMLTGRALRQHPARFYRGMVAEMGDLGPWVMERLWEELFRGPVGTARMDV